MKYKSLVLWLFFLMIIPGAKAQLSKNSLLSLLNDTGIETISTSQKKEMDGLNRHLVTEIYKVNSESKTKSERDLAIDKIFDKRDKDVDKLFGKDEKYLKKYKKEYRKRSRSLRMKVKLAKLIL